MFFSSTGDNAALMMEVMNDNPHPSYPIDLSGQILAYSRVYMSRILRALNAYHDPLYSFYYTDTDSLILHARCLPILKRCGLLGSGLGQLSCDLSDGAQFAKVLTGVWAAPKGPYSLGFVAPGTTTLMEKIKAKGFPHPSGPFPYGEEIDLNVLHEQKMDEDQIKWEKKKALLVKVKEWLKDPDHAEPPVEAIGQRFYVWHFKETGEAYFAAHINHNMIRLMMTGQGMKKRICTGLEPVALTTIDECFYP